MQPDFENSFDYLKGLESIIPKRYKKIFIALLNVLDDENLKHIKVRHNRLILKQEFLIYFSKHPLLEKLHVASTKAYDCIEYLKNNNYIDGSSDCFPIKKQLAQMNKHFSFLSPSMFHLIDKIEDFQQYIYSKLVTKNLELACFISLVYFEERRWDEDAIEKAILANYFIINNVGYQCILMDSLHDGFIGIGIYRIKQTSELLMKFYNNGNECKFRNYKFLKDEAEKEIESYFSQRVSSGNILRAIMMNKMLNEPSAVVSLKYKKVQSIPICLSELEYLYNNGVPKHLLEIEENNLKIIQSKMNGTIQEYDDYQDEMYIDTKFDYNNKVAVLFFFILNKQRHNLLDFTPESITQESIDRVKENFFNATKLEKDFSTLMVYEYMYYLLDKIYVGRKKSDGINITTFIDYVRLMRRHFFSLFTDFEHMDEMRLFFILNTYTLQGMAKKSLEKLKYLITDFFNFHNKKIGNYDVKIKHITKSLVFKEEIDVILKHIEIYFQNEAKKNSKRYSKFYKFLTIQHQAFIILAFYTGLRLNELRTRLHSDISEEPFYIYDNTITKDVYSVNVNYRGLKNINKINSFKSSNATRRVCFTIANELHSKIFKNFINSSSKYGKRYLFKDYDYKSSKILRSALELSKLSLLNKIIHDVTRRYATIHSLRHSYVTYWFLNRINSANNFNDSIMNFSIEVGHVTPQITGQSYLHYELLEEINNANKL